MKYALEIEGADVEIIGKGLDLLPFGIVKPVSDRLQVQINAQNAAAMAAAHAAAQPTQPQPPDDPPAAA